VRATRAGGQLTRATLLTAATELFAERGLNGVSIGEIASAADCFPSQVRYYFGDKESLFVETACEQILAVRDDVEGAARRARSPSVMVNSMVRAALAGEGMLMFVEAMILVRRRHDLAPRIRATFDALHARAERAATVILTRQNWITPASPAIQSRAFWSAIIGIALERSAMGEAFQADQAEAAVRAVMNLTQA
jgi:AcrR family transcriptional regulator